MDDLPPVPKGTDKSRDHFLVRVGFRSGATFDFWVYKFEMSTGRTTWQACGSRNLVAFAHDDVEWAAQLEAVPGK